MYFSIKSKTFLISLLFLIAGSLFFLSSQRVLAAFSVCQTSSGTPTQTGTTVSWGAIAGQSAYDVVVYNSNSSGACLSNFSDTGTVSSGATSANISGLTAGQWYNWVFKIVAPDPSVAVWSDMTACDSAYRFQTAVGVTDANISISGCTGTNGACKIGDTVTATWNNTSGGDNNSYITSATANLSQFGGGASVAMTNSSNTYTASYIILGSEAIDATNRNASVTATGYASNATTADTSNKTVDTIRPTISAAGSLAITVDNNSNGVANINDKITYTHGTPSSADGDFWAFMDTGTSAGITAAPFNATLDSGTTYTIHSGTANEAHSFTEHATDNSGNVSTPPTSIGSLTFGNVLPVVSITFPAADNQTITSDANNNFNLSYNLQYISNATFVSGQVLFHPASGSDTVCALPSSDLTATPSPGTAYSRINLSSCTGGTLTKGTTYAITVSVVDSGGTSGSYTRSSITYGGLTSAWTQDKWNGTAQAAPQYAFSQWDNTGFTNYCLDGGSGCLSSGNKSANLNLIGGGLFDSVSLKQLATGSPLNPTSDTDFNKGTYDNNTTQINGSGSGAKVQLSLINGVYGNDHATDTLDGDFSAGTTTNIFVGSGTIYPKKPATYACDSNNLCQSNDCENGTCFLCGTSTLTFSGLPYGTVVGADGHCWLDRNLGATAVATAYNSPTTSYGWLFQWGRKADGHQLTNSATVAGPVGTPTVAPPNDVKFITDNFIYDWLSPQVDTLWAGASGGVNNPCPTGWRLPTGGTYTGTVDGNGAMQGEWAHLVSLSGITNCTTAANSSLKLPAAGYRTNMGTLNQLDPYGYYQSSSPYSTGVYILYITPSGVDPASSNGRVNGHSVRCLKN